MHANAIATHPNGVEIHANAVATRPDGVATHADGVETRPDGPEMLATGVEIRPYPGARAMLCQRQAEREPRRDERRQGNESVAESAGPTAYRREDHTVLQVTMSRTPNDKQVTSPVSKRGVKIQDPDQ